MEKYENSRVVYMVLHQVKRQGRDFPTQTNDVLPFVQQNFHLLPEKDRIRLKKFGSAKKPQKPKFNKT